MRRVALIGNGLSIRASKGFAIPALTADVRHVLEEMDGGALVARLDAIGLILAADQADFRPQENFEHLLGPLDRLSLLLRGPLTEILAGPSQQQHVLHGAALTLGRNYVRGVGTVLEVIDQQELDENPVKEVVDWMLSALTAEDTLSVYTLNYDSLLDRWLLQAHNDQAKPSVRLDDEFAPFNATVVTLPNPLPNQIELFRLRDAGAARPRNVHLYHLHGGMHWVEYDNAIWKARDIDDLRDHDVFTRWAQGEDLPIHPHVLLTDQKTRAVAVEPFRSSYAALRDDLAGADRVMVAGYGFGDVPVNEALAYGWKGRRANSRWLAVERPRNPIKKLEKMKTVASVMAVAVPGGVLSISFAGLPGVVKEKPTFWS